MKKTTLYIFAVLLLSLSASVAQVGQAVMTSGNQTIAGSKTFSGDLKFTGPAAVVYTLDQDSSSSFSISTGTVDFAMEQDGDFLVPGGLYIHKNGAADTSNYYISGSPTGARVISLPDASITFGAFSPTLLNVADEAALKAAVNLEIGTDVQAYDADLGAVAGLATTGIVARTGAGTAATRTITGTANQVAVANGDGVAGNPTLSIPTNAVLPGQPTIPSYAATNLGSDAVLAADAACWEVLANGPIPVELEALDISTSGTGTSAAAGTILGLSVSNAAADGDTAVATADYFLTSFGSGSNTRWDLNNVRVAVNWECNVPPSAGQYFFGVFAGSQTNGVLTGVGWAVVATGITTVQLQVHNGTSLATTNVTVGNQDLNNWHRWVIVWTAPNTLSLYASKGSPFSQTMPRVALKGTAVHPTGITGAGSRRDLRLIVEALAAGPGGGGTPTATIRRLYYQPK